MVGEEEKRRRGVKGGRGKRKGRKRRSAKRIPDLESRIESCVHEKKTSPGNVHECHFLRHFLFLANPNYSFVWTGMKWVDIAVQLQEPLPG